MELEEITHSDIKTSKGFKRWAAHTHPGSSFSACALPCLVNYFHRKIFVSSVTPRENPLGSRGGGGA